MNLVDKFKNLLKPAQEINLNQGYLVEINTFLSELNYSKVIKARPETAVVSMNRDSIVLIDPYREMSVLDGFPKNLTVQLSENEYGQKDVTLPIVFEAQGANGIKSCRVVHSVQKTKQGEIIVRSYNPFEITAVNKQPALTENPIAAPLVKAMF